MTRPWLAALLALAATAAAADDATVHRRYLYREADDGRTVARIELFLDLAGDEVALSLAIHCRGPEIDPALGAIGVRGENLVTASEFATLLAPDQHCVRSLALDTAGALPVTSSFATAAKAPLVHRRFDATAGSFADEAVGSHPVEMRCRLVHPARPGRYRTMVEVAGRARLGVLWHIDTAGAARIDWIGQPVSRPAAWRLER